ncbi:MAG: porin family protein [Alphaproteobacteria bacterium]
MKKTLLLAGVACVLSFNSNASEIKPYVGLDVGVVSADLANGYDLIAEDSLYTYSVNAGAKINDNFGLEAFYQTSSEEDKTIGALTTTTSFDAYGLDVIGYLPITEKTNLLGSVGLAQYDFELKATGLATESEDGLGCRFAVGADYNLTDNVSFRAMARYVTLDTDNVDSLTEFSVGARYSF